MPRGLRRERALLRGFDAVIAHTAHGASRLRDEVGVEPERVHVIPHGPLDYLTELAGRGAAARPSWPRPPTTCR